MAASYSGPPSSRSAIATCVSLRDTQTTPAKTRPPGSRIPSKQVKDKGVLPLPGKDLTPAMMCHSKQGDLFVCGAYRVFSRIRLRSRVCRGGDVHDLPGRVPGGCAGQPGRDRTGTPADGAEMGFQPSKRLIFLPAPASKKHNKSFGVLHNVRTCGEQPAGHFPNEDFMSPELRSPIAGGRRGSQARSWTCRTARRRPGLAAPLLPPPSQITAYIARVCTGVLSPGPSRFF